MISWTNIDINLYHRSINILVSNLCVPEYSKAAWFLEVECQKINKHILRFDTVSFNYLWMYPSPAGIYSEVLFTPDLRWDAYFLWISCFALLKYLTDKF